MDSAREAFRIAHPAGAHCILDAFIGHPRRLNEVLEEECHREPRLRSVIKDWVPRTRIERMEEEAALADSIVVGSRFAGETFVARGTPASKVVTIPYGVDTRLFVPRTEQDGPRDKARLKLLFVGNVSVRKGSHYLFEAMRTLAPEHITLTVVGTMEDRYFLEQCGTLFKWVPFVRHTDLPLYFRDADAYVFPSLFEGSALSVYEALASGLPVVTTNESGSVVRDGTDGIIIPSRNSDAIIRAIRTLAGAPELRDRFGKNARQRAEEFTWDTYSTHVVDLVRRLG
jgi:glycosyltransferase involved in cell wall biosynthesis